MGGPVPVLHGGEGDARTKPPRSGKEMSGPLQTVPDCQREWRPGHGETDSFSFPTVLMVAPTLVSVF